MTKAPALVVVPFDLVEALATIDRTISACASRELVSTAEVTDAMLDLRQLLVGAP